MRLLVSPDEQCADDEGERRATRLVVRRDSALRTVGITRAGPRRAMCKSFVVRRLGLETEVRPDGHRDRAGARGSESRGPQNRADLVDEIDPYRVVFFAWFGE